MIPDIPGIEFADLNGMTFPLADRDTAVSWIVGRIAGKKTTGIAFPDMKTMNLLRANPAFLKICTDRLFTMNDGAGVKLASRRMGRPFPDNLNGTDLTPALFRALPANSRIFAIGAEPDVIGKACDHIRQQWPHIVVAGFHHGYFGESEEKTVVDAIAAASPDVILVGMGNPKQCEFIDRHMDDPRLAGSTWLAIGGLFNHFAGTIRRPASVFRRLKLEWLGYVFQQPYKIPLYLFGIPKFVAATVAEEFRPARRDVPVVIRCKTLARELLVCAGRTVGSRPDRNPRILCYHGVCVGGDPQWTVNPAVFERQMKSVAGMNPVAIETAIEPATAGHHCISVTFDDGYMDVLETAAPVMARYGIPGTVFVSPDFMQGKNPGPGYAALRPFMNIDHVRQLADAGWEIGSHCLSHSPLSAMPREKAAAELSDSKMRLEDMIGRPVRYVAYPFGTPSRVSGDNRADARSAGYLAGFMAVTGHVDGRCERYSIPRSKVLGTDNFHVFAGTLDGLVDLWALVETRGRGIG